MPTTDEKIQSLSNQQALSILDSLAGEFSTADLPDTKAEQVQVLQALFQQAGHDLDLAPIAIDDAVTDDAQAAEAARRLLSLLAQVPEVQPSLAEWLDNPPTQEAAAVPLILAAPVVLTGCIAFLNVVGHVRFVRHKDGTWDIDYNPAKKTPLDNTMKDTVRTLANLMMLFKPG
jgi:hypothetical protein